MSIAIITSAGSTGIDEPPGMTPFNFLPPRMPPAISSSFANGVPSFTAKLPGLLTCPDTEKILVPPLLGLPIDRNQSAPWVMIHGTAAKVSVLLMVVGLPDRPYEAGNGGLKRGSPFLPSSDSR